MWLRDKWPSSPLKSLSLSMIGKTSSVWTPTHRKDDMWPKFIFKHWQQLNFKISTIFQFQNHNPIWTSKYWKEFCIFIEHCSKIPRSLPPISIWILGRTFYLVDNFLILHVVKRLRGHRINNFSTFLAESHISTTKSANYLGKYCVRFFKHLNVKTSNIWRWQFMF